MCYIDDADSDWVNLAWKLRRARKNYPCMACNTGIKKGQLYRYFNGIYERDSFHSGRRCLRCDAIAEAMEARGCDIDFSIGAEWGEPCEQDNALVPETEPICELPFLSYEELEQRSLKG